MELAYNPGDILRETRQAVAAAPGNSLKTLTVEGTVIGLFFTGVN